MSLWPKQKRLAQKQKNKYSKFFCLCFCRRSNLKRERKVAMESWLSSWQNAWDVIQEEYPATAPRSLGSMGYDGRVSLFISQTVRETAWEGEGFSLEFYRSYNVTWHNAARYFDGPQSLNTSLLKRCNETRLMLSIDMKLYLEITGDWDGVDVVNETVLGKCFDEYFWFLGSIQQKCVLMCLVRRKYI